MTHVYTKIAKLDEKIVNKYADIGVATIYEAAGRAGSVDPAIKPLSKGVHLIGRALTVHCHPKDNLMLHKALQIACTGDVIVASVDGYYDAGYWGGLMATSAMARNVAGLAIDGCVRDSEEIIAMGFPTFCRGTCIRGTAKDTLGTVNHPILFGGVIVHPGDLIVGDDDGMVVVSTDRLDEVLAASHMRVEKEKGKAAALSAGTSSVQLNRLDEVFRSLGLVEEEV